MMPRAFASFPPFVDALVVGALFVGALTSSTACRSRDTRNDPDPETTAKLAPLAAPPSSLMPVAGFGSAVLVAPVGATRAMPLIVAVLGIGDTPESQCAVWRELAWPRAFVLCPRFTPHYVAAPDDTPGAGPDLLGVLGLAGESAPEADPNAGAVVQSGFRPTEVAEVEREVEAAVATLRKLFPRHLASGPVVYAGFSRGAFLGATLVARSPAKYARAVLIEGGQSAWTEATASAFAKGGGQRILFACGQPSCVAESEPASALLARARVTARVVHGEGEGHGYKGAVKQQLRAALPWLLEGDARWSAEAPRPR